MRFWATICKVVCPLLWDRCLSFPYVSLCVTSMYRGQTVGWIDIPLGTEVGLYSCTVSHGDPALPTDRGTVRLSSFHHISISDLDVGTTRTCVQQCAIWWWCLCESYFPTYSMKQFQSMVSLLNVTHLVETYICIWHECHFTNSYLITLMKPWNTNVWE